MWKKIYIFFSILMTHFSSFFNKLLEVFQYENDLNQCMTHTQWYDTRSSENVMNIMYGLFVIAH